MTTIKAFIDKHPVPSYYALVFAISWGSILLVAGLGPGGFSATPQQFQKAVPYAVPAMVLGPAVAGILLTGLIDGRAGLREFRARLLKWRVGARWYAVALFTAPLLIMGVMLLLSLISPEFLPRIFIATDKASPDYSRERSREVVLGARRRGATALCLAVDVPFRRPL